MRNVCIITAHPFWNEPLGCGSLMRSRYELLSQLCDRLSVIFITRSAKTCPLPNSGTLKVSGDFTEDHVDAVKGFVEREAVGTCFFSYNVFDQLAARLPCRTAVEIHDVLHLRQQQFEAFGYEPPVKASKEEELASLARFDRVLCINKDEARYLEACGVSGVSYLPPATAFNPAPGPPGGNVAGLIGSAAVPNVDGLRSSIAFIGKLPHLVIAGGLSGQPVLDEAGGPGIERLGVVADVREFYARINVALSPVRFGGGLKIKVFEALANGKPVIATSHAVEGFPEGIRDVVRVEDDFARWNLDLLGQAAAISPSAIAAYFTAHFSPEAGRALLGAVL